jgi:hypothetical protein
VATPGGLVTVSSPVKTHSERAGVKVPELLLPGDLDTPIT